VHASLKIRRFEVAALSLMFAMYFAAMAMKFQSLEVALSIVAGLWLILRSSKVAVEGLRSAVMHMGQTEYIAGMISSFASNTPELAVALIMVIKGMSIQSKSLIETAVLTVIITAGFDVLVLGILIVMMSWSKGELPFPYRAIAHESDIIRMTIIICSLMFSLGVIEGNEGFIPQELGLLLILTYVSYLVLAARSQKEHYAEKPKLSGNATILYLCAGFASMIIGGKLLTNVAEHILHNLHLPVVVTAMIIGCLSSVPEYGIIILSASKGHVEMGLANLLAGMTQCIFIAIGLMSLLTSIPLDGYIMFQLISIAATLWMVKKAILDDNKLTLDEGMFIIILQVMVFIMLERLRA